MMRTSFDLYERVAFCHDHSANKCPCSQSEREHPAGNHPVTGVLINRRAVHVKTRNVPWPHSSALPLPVGGHSQGILAAPLLSGGEEARGSPSPILRPRPRPRRTPVTDPRLAGVAETGCGPDTPTPGPSRGLNHFRGSSDQNSKSFYPSLKKKSFVTSRSTAHLS